METMPKDLILIRDAARMVDRGYSTLRAWVRAGHLKAYQQEPQLNAPLYLSRAEVMSWMVTGGKAMRPPRGRHHGDQEEDTAATPIEDTQVRIESGHDAAEAEDSGEPVHLSSGTKAEERSPAEPLASLWTELVQAKADLRTFKSDMARITAERDASQRAEARAEAEARRLRSEVERLHGEAERVQAELRLSQKEREAARNMAEAQHEIVATIRLLVEAQQGHLKDLGAALEAERASMMAARLEIEALRQSQQLPWWRRLLSAG